MESHRGSEGEVVNSPRDPISLGMILDGAKDSFSNFLEILPWPEDKLADEDPATFVAKKNKAASFKIGPPAEIDRFHFPLLRSGLNLEL